MLNEMKNMNMLHLSEGRKNPNKKVFQEGILRHVLGEKSDHLAES